MQPEIGKVSQYERICEHDPQILTYLQNEASHGLSHSLETADLTFSIGQSPEYSGRMSDDDLIVLRHAGLLHDIGYGENKPYWSGMQEEHPSESARIAVNVLENLSFYKSHPEKLGQVAWLIYNHDNTNYTFPAYWLFEQEFLSRKAPNTATPRLIPGTTRDLPTPFQKKLGENCPQVSNINDHLIDLLQIIQEADSRLGSAQRTLDFCDKRRVPRFSNEGGVDGVGPLWWQGSATANIILALNRALLDAHTESGKLVAIKIYEDGFKFVRDIYEQNMDNSSKIKLERRLEPIGQLANSDIEKIFKRPRRERWVNYGTEQTHIESATNLCGTLLDLQEQFQKNLVTAASRIVPIDYINEASNTITSEYEKKKMFSYLQVRDQVIKNYGVDVLTQLVGTTKVQVRDHDPVLHDEIYAYSLQQPVIFVKNMGDISHPPYSLQTGDDLVNKARTAGLDKLRVTFVQT